MIEFRNVKKAYRSNVVLKDINLSIKDREITVLIGPSGCGKTTTLRMINRMVEPSGGSILIDGNDITKADKVKLRRGIGYVIQSGGLFPHLTIRENIEMIPKLEGKPAEETYQKTVDLMRMIDLDPEQYLDRYPRELSGGQQQRIGVARAFANDPEIILFDEPFSALDPITRNSLQDELVQIQEHAAKTIVFVTHDMDEAIKIADRICIMNQGKVVQFDTPENILKNPVNDFVKDFVGVNRIWSSPEYIKVENFMIREPVTCKPETTARKCLEKMRQRRIDSLACVDANGVLIGMVGKRSFYKDRHPETPAERLVLPLEYTAHPDDSVLDILNAIQDTDSNNIPVIDEAGKLVGLLTSSRLVSVMSKQFIEEDE